MSERDDLMSDPAVRSLIREAYEKGQAASVGLDDVATVQELDLLLVSRVPLLRDELVAIGYEQGRRDGIKATVDGIAEVRERLGAS